MQQPHIIFFTKYTSEGPSSRYRTYQYLSYYQQAGYSIQVKPLFPSSYIHTFYSTGKKPMLTVIWAYLKRIAQIVSVNKQAILFIEYELLPFVPLWVEKLLLAGKNKCILDYDDAIFHNYDKSNSAMVRWLCGNKIYGLVQIANTVITGSPYLTAQLVTHQRNIIEIPTSIVFANYQLQEPKKNNKPAQAYRFGWIGSMSSAKNVQLIVAPFKKLQEKYSCELVFIGFPEHLQPILDGVQCTFIPWDAVTEIEQIYSFDAGIMPLEDTPFNNGKCGFKLIQYMACGKPTISTPLAANKAINRYQQNLHASSEAEWETAMEQMIVQSDQFKKVGEENRNIVQQYYSTEANAHKYLSIFQSLFKKEL